MAKLLAQHGELRQQLQDILSTAQRPEGRSAVRGHGHGRGRGSERHGQSRAEGADAGQSGERAALRMIREARSGAAGEGLRAFVALASKDVDGAQDNVGR